jgi:hypothetical protein
MKPTTTTERRQSERKQMKSGIVALLQSDSLIEIGKVIDVSCDGLSFYINDGKLNKDIKNPLQMDMLLTNENVFLEHVKISVVSNTMWKDDPQISKYQTIIRYGVKFEDLESSQKIKLKKLTTK